MKKLLLATALLLFGFFSNSVNAQEIEDSHYNLSLIHIYTC